MQIPRKRGPGPLVPLLLGMATHTGFTRSVLLCDGNHNNNYREIVIGATMWPRPNESTQLAAAMQSTGNTQPAHNLCLQPFLFFLGFFFFFSFYYKFFFFVWVVETCWKRNFRFSTPSFDCLGEKGNKNNGRPFTRAE